MTARSDTHPAALYIHIPWCVRKCPYCDFNSHVAENTIPEHTYVAALLSELEQRQQEFAIAEFSTVFFGGGTPSLFSAGSIAALLEGADARVGLAVDAEITLEANPGASDYQRFKGYHDAGVNRLSIGIQSFNDRLLDTLGRIHTVAEAKQAVIEAQTAGFKRLNIDLMYGLPEQTAAECQHDLQQAIALSPEHLSLYQLTIEAHTKFHAHPPQLPMEDTMATMEEQLLGTVQAAGFERYEVSAYARIGDYCRHNLNYWQFGDYLGIGAGAHSKLTTGQIRHRLWNRKRPSDYIDQATDGDVTSGRSRLEPADLVAEFAINALRLTAGFTLEQFTAATGLPKQSLREPIDQGQARGWLKTDGQRVRTTAEGYRLLNNVIELFL